MQLPYLPTYGRAYLDTRASAAAVDCRSTGNYILSIFHITRWKSDRLTWPQTRQPYVLPGRHNLELACLCRKNA